MPPDFPVTLYTQAPVPLLASLPSQDAAGQRSVARVTDQTPPRPEQQHQENTDDPEHCKGRLIQHDLDPIGPEPGRMTFERDPQGLLARLMDIVPEFGEFGQPQRLVRNRALAVVDQEDESGGEQEKTDKTKEPPDHG